MKLRSKDGGNRPLATPAIRFWRTTGVNNPGLGLGHPFAAILEWESLLKSRFRPEDPFGFEASAVSAYALFSWLDIWSHLTPIDGALPGVNWLRMNGERGLFLANLGRPDCELLVHLNKTLEIVAIGATNELIGQHAKLAELRQLDHPLSKSELDALQILHFEARNPDGNSRYLSWRKGLREDNGNKAK